MWPLGISRHTAVFYTTTELNVVPQGIPRGRFEFHAIPRYFTRSLNLTSYREEFHVAAWNFTRYRGILRDH